MTRWRPADYQPETRAEAVRVLQVIRPPLNAVRLAEIAALIAPPKRQWRGSEARFDRRRAP